MTDTRTQSRALMTQISGVLTTAIGRQLQERHAYCFTLENVKTHSVLGLAIGLCLKDTETSDAAKTALVKTRGLLDDYRCTFKLSPVPARQVLVFGQLTLKLAHLVTGFNPIPALVVIDFVPAKRPAHKGFNRQHSSVLNLEPDTDNKSLKGLTGVLIACNMESETVTEDIKHQLEDLKTTLLNMEENPPCPFLKY